MPAPPPASGADRGRGTTTAPRTPAPAPAARRPATPAAGAAPSAASPGTAAAGAVPGAVAAVPLVRGALRTQLLAPDATMSDIIDPLLTSLLAEGLTQAQFDTRYGDPVALKRAIIQKWCATGATPTTVKRFAINDPIATQKFADVDQEAYLVDDSLKTVFYDGMLTEIRKPGADRNRVFPLMQRVKRAAGLDFKGKQVPPAEVSKFSTRNHSVKTMYGHMTAAAKAEVDRLVRAELTKKGVPLTPANLNNEDLRRKAFRHWLKTQPEPHKQARQSENLSNYATWYHPGHIQPTAPKGGLAYNQMMTLGALQPEWYPDGTAVLNITKANTAARELRKPTAFDGMESALWVARNQPGQTYGVTGGGAGEFLEKGLTYADVTASTVQIRSDDFVIEIERLAAEARTKNSSAMEEALRGNAMGTSSAPADQSVHIHQRVMNRTTREAEQGGPTALPPSGGGTAPGAGGNPGASPGAAVRGGTFDRSRQTPVR